MSIAYLLFRRNDALAHGDRNVARECQIELDRLGYVEQQNVVPDVTEQAIPVKRPRGRPRKNPLPTEGATP